MDSLCINLNWMSIATIRIADLASTNIHVSFDLFHQQFNLRFFFSIFSCFSHNLFPILKCLAWSNQNEHQLTCCCLIIINFVLLYFVFATPNMPSGWLTCICITNKYNTKMLWWNNINFIIILYFYNHKFTWIFFSHFFSCSSSRSKTVQITDQRSDIHWIYVDCWAKGSIATNTRPFIIINILTCIKRWNISGKFKLALI